MTSPNSGPADPSQPPQGSAPRMRASDADRESVVGTLHDAVARGLLNLEEGDERMRAAYGARFLDDLPRLTWDLPPAPVPAPTAPGWRVLTLLAWLQLRAALARSSWRDSARSVRARPRLALALIAVLAVLSVAAVSGGDGFDHRPGIERAEHWGPR
jgi:Domain of unknown function (DUF1707)